MINQNLHYQQFYDQFSVSTVADSGMVICSWMPTRGIHLRTQYTTSHFN